MMNLKVGFRRVYIVLHVCWVIGGLSLYLLGWPGEHDPESDTWAENINACQSRARSYDNEERFNNLARQSRHALPEVPNFGHDDHGLQITTLEDALRECKQRYPFPRYGFWHEVFRSIKRESPVFRSILAAIVFFVPTFAYILLYGLTLAVGSSLQWIRRGFLR